MYDVKGKEIQTLVSERIKAERNEVRFDGSGLTSGVYLYVMTAGDFKATKRMILLK